MVQRSRTSAARCRWLSIDRASRGWSSKAARSRCGATSALATGCGPTRRFRARRGLSRRRESCSRRPASRGVPTGRSLDRQGQRVEFTIVTSATSAQRTAMATLIQADLKELGMDVRVVPLEFRALVDRVFETFDYDATVQGIGGGDADPNAEMGVWLSRGANHMWRLGQKTPATPWEAEIDRLMQQQLSTLDVGKRKALYDRVQTIVAEQVPFIFLAAPHILVGGRGDLGNFTAGGARSLHAVERGRALSSSRSFSELNADEHAGQRPRRQTGASHRSRAGGGVCLGRRAGVERADRSLQPADLLDPVETRARPRSGRGHFPGGVSGSRRRAPTSTRSAGAAEVAHSDDAAQGLEVAASQRPFRRLTRATAPSRPRRQRPTCRTPSFARCSRPRPCATPWMPCPIVAVRWCRCCSSRRPRALTRTWHPALGVATGSIGFLRGRCLDRLRSALEGIWPVPIAVAPPSLTLRPAGVRDKALAQSLIEQSRELLRVDFHRALTCAHDAAAIAEEISDVHLHALSTRAVANALSVGGNNQASIEHHAQAIGVFDLMGDKAELARTLSAAVQPLLLLGRYDEALSFAERARGLFEKLGDAVRIARLEITIGNLLPPAGSFRRRHELVRARTSGAARSGRRRRHSHRHPQQGRHADDAEQFSRRARRLRRGATAGRGAGPRSGRRAGRLQHRLAVLPAW